jgi:hypothetical protein
VYKKRLIFFNQTKDFSALRAFFKALRGLNIYTGRGLLQRETIYKLKARKKRR